MNTTPTPSASAPRGLVPPPPSRHTAIPGRSRINDLETVESPFTTNLRREARERRKFLLTLEWAILATIAAVIGWGFYIVGVYRVAKAS